MTHEQMMNLPEWKTWFETLKDAEKITGLSNLESSIKSVIKATYDVGYDEGFQVGAAAERGIIAVNQKIDKP